MRSKNCSVIILSLLFIAIGCKTEKKTESIRQEGQEEVTVNPCFKKSEKELAIASILKTEEFQTFLHPEVEGRLPIHLVKNDFITADLKITSNGQEIQYRESLDLPEGKVHRIKITNIDCENREFSYSVFYPIEGAIIQGDVSKINSEWVASVTHVGEKD